MTTTRRNFRPALLWAVFLAVWPLRPLAQQAPPLTSQEQNLELVREVISQAREAGIAGNPDEISPLAIEAGVIRLGEAALPGALAILENRSEELIVLGALLRAAVDLAGLADPRICSTIQDVLTATADGSDAVPWDAALAVLRDRTGYCRDSIQQVAALYTRTDSREVRLEVIDTLGWLGQTPADFELVIGLAGEAPDECERRLLAAAGLRILDRVMPPAEEAL